jgi:hypothetical protein
LAPNPMKTPPLSCFSTGNRLAIKGIRAYTSRSTGATRFKALLRLPKNFAPSAYSDKKDKSP